MIKKIATIVMALCFVSTLAFAASATSTINPGVAGGSSDVAADFTYNDGAWAKGGSFGTAENYGTAGSIGFKNVSTFAAGTADQKSLTGATAGAADFGQTSVAGAAVGTVDTVQAYGVSGYAGKFGAGAALNTSKGTVEGSVAQGNYANEVGYGSGTFATAGNTSGASFTGKAADFDASVGASFGNYSGSANSGIKMIGAAGAAGSSIASVDAYGNHQTAFAATGNTAGATVIGADCDKTKVYGNGDVAAGANAFSYNAGASAGGTGSFSYKGETLGAGASVMNSQATAGNGYSSSSASGASFSAVK
jgi:hypothetical protein